MVAYSYDDLVISQPRCFLLNVVRLVRPSQTQLGRPFVISDIHISSVCMKLNKYLVDFLVGPIILLVVTVVGGVIFRWNLPESELARAVLGVLLLPPLMVALPIIEFVLSDCPGLFDGGPCEGREYAMTFFFIVLWWGLLSLAIGAGIRFIRSRIKN